MCQPWSLNIFEGERLGFFSKAVAIAASFRIICDFAALRYFLRQPDRYMIFSALIASIKIMSDQHIKSGIRAGIALAAGVASISAGAIFTRYAQREVASLTIAAYRMAIAFAVVLIPLMIRHRQELRSLSYRDLGLSALAGLFLAIHFAAWIYSLEFTSVAVSVVLVNTAPLWVALFTLLLFRERLSRTTASGIAIAVLGAVVIGCGLESSASSSSHLYGAVLALIGALGVALYLLIGRSLRRRCSLVVYITVCYGTAAGYLVLAALCTGQQLTGFSSST